MQNNINENKPDADLILDLLKKEKWSYIYNEPGSGSIEYINRELKYRGKTALVKFNSFETHKGIELIILDRSNEDWTVIDIVKTMDNDRVINFIKSNKFQSISMAIMCGELISTS